MSGQIFISYRREDASYPAGRLYDNLHTRFPQNEIFMDVDSIKPGVDFIKTIEERVGACDVLVAVIGKRWLSVADQEGRCRLDNPEDFVRVEVGTALKRGVRVIPVLVEGAPMPPADQLPEDLKPLARRNALSLSHEGFRGDSERLMDSVGEILEAARGEGAPRAPEGQQPPRGRATGPGQTELLPGSGAGPGAPPFNNRTFLKGVSANLQRPRRWLVVLGLGVAACLLGVGLFKATRPPSVSIGGSSSPTPASPNLILSDAEDWLAAAQRHLNEKDYKKARPFLQKAAAAGNAEAMNNLGWLYQNSLGVVLDYAQAREWYQKAAAAGNADGMNSLGWLYQNGLGVAPDYAQARQWFQKAAAAGHATAINNLANLYYQGLGVAQDYGQAREWYEKAAAVGNASAMCSLGYLYEQGLSVAQDYAQARQWYQKAAGAGNAYAKQALLRLPSTSSPLPASSPSPVSQASVSPTPSGAEWFAEAKRYFDAQDYAQALPPLKEAADAGNVEAMTNLGWLYQNGLGVVLDYAQAREWSQKAAEAGNTYAMNNLGWLYQNGQGVAQDYDKAREWYQKAVEAGNMYAMNNLGWLYQNGQGVAQDYDKAAQWYQKAAAAGNANAMNNLGWLYQNGQGVAQEYAQAAQWYLKAAAAGNAYAMANLGALYVNGWGVTQDYAQARQWFQKAAGAGNAYAKQALAQLPSK